MNTNYNRIINNKINILKKFLFVLLLSLAINKTQAYTQSADALEQIEMKMECPTDDEKKKCCKTKKGCNSNKKAKKCCKTDKISKEKSSCVKEKSKELNLEANSKNEGCCSKNKQKEKSCSKE